MEAPNVTNEELCKRLSSIKELLDPELDWPVIDEAIRRLQFKSNVSFNDEAFSI